VSAAEVTETQLAEMMVGHSIGAEGTPSPVRSGDVRLQVRDLVVRGDRGHDAVRGITLEICAGEVVGIAGVSGNGQRELAEAIACLRPPEQGSIRLNGVELVGRKPAAARRAGLGYVPEERIRDGIIGDFSVAENLMLVDSRRSAFVRLGFLRRSSVRGYATQLVSTFDVRAPGIDTPVRNLSGGNIQKLILARELSGNPRFLLVAQPTRGIDIAATSYIHERLREEANKGTAVLVISEDLDEVIAISDRVLVMYEGSVVGEIDPRVANRETIGLLMAGALASAKA